jgi:hypothetical protein
MTRTSKFSRRLRQRRDDREFSRALRTASPAMQQELMAAAAHQYR